MVGVCPSEYASTILQTLPVVLASQAIEMNLAEKLAFVSGQLEALKRIKFACCTK